MDGNDYIELVEFLLIFKHLEPNKYSFIKTREIFDKSSESFVVKNSTVVGLSFAQFCIVCTEYDIFKWETQFRFLGLENPVDIINAAADLYTNFELKTNVLRDRLRPVNMWISYFYKAVSDIKLFASKGKLRLSKSNLIYYVIDHIIYIYIYIIYIFIVALLVYKILERESKLIYIEYIYIYILLSGMTKYFLGELEDFLGPRDVETDLSIRQLILDFQEERTHRKLKHSSMTMVMMQNKLSANRPDAEQQPRTSVTGISITPRVRISRIIKPASSIRSPPHLNESRNSDL